MKRAWILAGLFGIVLMLICFASADIRINEVMPKPISTYEEWVEIYNDGSENLILANWKINDTSTGDPFSINISAEGFALVLDDALSCSSFNISSESCIEILNIGNGLSDSDNLYIYNESYALMSNFAWTTATLNKTWQYCSGNWIENPSTPGSENNCITTQTCTQNWSCGSWGSCNSSEMQTRTCTDTNNCGNLTGKPAINQSCEDDDITIELSWDDADIINGGEEFEITVDTKNLEDDHYDTKVWIEDDDENIISERYGNYSGEDIKWAGGDKWAYYFIGGSGDESEIIKLRLKSSYENFKGDATIFAKIRENGKTAEIDTFEDSIEILENENETFAAQATAGSNNSITNGAIRLGRETNYSSKDSEEADANSKSSIIYKSKNEYIKEYAVYGFSLLCVGLIILLLTDKK